MPLVVTLQFYMEFYKRVNFGSLFSISISLIYLVDTIECNIASFADVNTLHNLYFSLDIVIGNLEKPTT